MFIHTVQFDTSLQQINQVHLSLNGNYSGRFHSSWVLRVFCIWMVSCTIHIWLSQILWNHLSLIKMCVLPSWPGWRRSHGPAPSAGPGCLVVCNKIKQIYDSIRETSAIMTTLNIYQIDFEDDMTDKLHFSHLEVNTFVAVLNNEFEFIPMQVPLLFTVYLPLMWALFYLDLFLT